MSSAEELAAIKRRLRQSLQTMPLAKVQRLCREATSMHTEVAHSVFDQAIDACGKRMPYEAFVRFADEIEQLIQEYPAMAPEELTPEIYANEQTRIRAILHDS